VAACNHHHSRSVRASIGKGPSVTVITFWRVAPTQCKMEIPHAVTQVTAINQQRYILLLGEVQPGHLAVGQNSQYAGLGGASLTRTNTETRWWVSSKKSPACITQRGSRADLEVVPPGQEYLSHKGGLFDVTAITFWRWDSLSVALNPQTAKPPAGGLAALPSFPRRCTHYTASAGCRTGRKSDRESIAQGRFHSICKPVAPTNRGNAEHHLSAHGPAPARCCP